jgi:uncharacterized protein (DUF1800 family)
MTRSKQRSGWAGLALAMTILAGNAGHAGAQTDATAGTTLTPRAQVQYLLRRFSFSASPATVSSVVSGGVAAWLAAQDSWQTLDDSASELETLPTALVNGGYPDFNIFERAVYQHMILTPRQLQAKLELHWLDHFSVGLQTVGDPAVMYHYDQTLRADALGNFAQLLSDVGQEGAMLVWLSNNYNGGDIPNENYARENMQLYSTGVYALNDDGTVKLDKAGTPALEYSQKDVVNLARAMTGYGLVFDPNNTNPQTRFSVQYFPSNHYSGTITYFNRVQPVPTDGTAINFVAAQLAARSSTAPFQVKELLQRFVTEKPPARYISDIVQVWRKYEKAPDQIARVISAIVNHPLFLKYYNSMPKQPAELMFGALRQLPGAMQATSNVTPGGSLLWELSGLSQQLFWPESVFSFYHPGFVGDLTNTYTVVDRTSVFANFANADPANAYTDTYIDIGALRTAMGSTRGKEIATYLLDALVDGGSANLQTEIYDFLGAVPDDNQVRGAIWLILNSPDYSVN